MKYDVLGLGNPLIDFILHVDDSFLSTLGLEKGSMNLVDVERQKKILDTSKQYQNKTALGGSCANTMVMVSQLGGKAAYGGKLGIDDFGRDFELQITENGVDSFLRKQEGMTGSTIILVTPDADRTMNTHLGMCQNYAEEDLNLKSIADSQYLYVEGYLWDTPKQKKTVVAALEHAKSTDTKIALTLSDSFCVERHSNDFLNLMDNYVDLLFCNDLEAFHMSDSHDLDQQLKFLSERVEHVVITSGTKGASIIFKQNRFNIDSFKVKVKDTTGAGDSFAAGYLYGVTQNYSPAQAGTLASYCAATIVSQDGPRFNGDFRVKVKKYLLSDN